MQGGSAAEESARFEPGSPLLRLDLSTHCNPRIEGAQFVNVIQVAKVEEIVTSSMVG